MASRNRTEAFNSFKLKRSNIPNFSNKINEYSSNKINRFYSEIKKTIANINLLLSELDNMTLSFLRHPFDYDTLNILENIKELTSCIKKLINVLLSFKNKLYEEKFEKYLITILSDYISFKSKELTINCLHIENEHKNKIKHFQKICLDGMVSMEYNLEC